MNRVFCEREDQTAAAIRSGAVHDEIASHARHCPACSDILLVSEFLREDCALADHEQTALPDPSHIWQKARLRSRQEAVRLAMRPIRFMKIIAIVAFACSPWLRLLLPIGREFAASWSKAFDLNLAFVSKVWPAAANQAAILLSFGAATILLSLSSWYMLRQE
jgi:hypothetical protein